MFTFSMLDLAGWENLALITGYYFSLSSDRVPHKGSLVDVRLMTDEDFSLNLFLLKLTEEETEDTVRSQRITPVLIT